jgi:hypothetical protein
MDSSTSSPTSSSASSSRPASPYELPPPQLSAAPTLLARDNALAGPSTRPHSLFSQATPTAAAYAAGHSQASGGPLALSRKSSARSKAGRFWLGGRATAVDRHGPGGSGTRSGSATEEEMSERDYHDDV